MAENKYFMGQDGFIWFVGVVEDRNDPISIGRVRVRCLGFHTADLNELPTADLPWAHVMHPVTDPAMHGMGSTPSFLVEGSWVIGFFRDAQEKQQPIIIGSLPGVPSEEANYSEGFNDPRSPYTNQVNYAGAPTYGPYPVEGFHVKMKSGHEVGEPDTNRLALGPTSETHTSLIKRRLNRLRGDPTKKDETIGVDDNSRETDEEKMKGTGIPIATQPYLLQVSDEAIEETRGWWDEPHPKSITKNTKVYRSGQYPFNHVHESESGHIHEIDDTVGGERLFTQHTSGTFEEIHPKGDRVVKVVGDNYEIIAKDSKVLISGSVNLTVAGSVRELIKGDYHLEVEGNYTQKIHKNHRVKVGAGEGGGNREEEIRGNYAYQIGGVKIDPDTGEKKPMIGNVKGRVSGNVDTIIEKSEVRIINDTSSLSVQNAIKIAATGPTYSEEPFGISGDITIVANNNISTTTLSGITSFKSGDKLNMKSATTMHIKSETTIDMDATTEVDVDSALINLN